MASDVERFTTHDREYRRDVGTAGAVFLVVNGLIGSGILLCQNCSIRLLGRSLRGLCWAVPWQ
jgi:hypothetical protein